MFRMTRGKNKFLKNEHLWPTYLPAGIDHKDDIWKMSNNAHPKTSVTRAVKMKHLHKAFEVMLNCFVNLAFLDSVAWMESD